MPKLAAALTAQMAKEVRDWVKLRAISNPMCTESQIVRMLLEKQRRPDLDQCLAAANAMTLFVQTGEPLLAELPKEHDIMQAFFSNIRDRARILRLLVADCKEFDREFQYEPSRSEGMKTE